VIVIGAELLSASISRLAADKDFAEVVAGEEKLGGGEVFEDLFDHPVVEVLGGAATILFGKKKGVAALHLVGEDGYLFNSLVGVEDGQERGTGPGDGEDLLEDGFEKFRTEILERVPKQHRVEFAFLVPEGVFDKNLDAVGFEFALEVAGAVPEG